MRWLLLAVVAVCLVGCSRGGLTATPDPDYDFVGMWPIMVCPDGDIGFPYMKIGETQYYYCY